MNLDQSVFSTEELSLAITNLPTRIGNPSDIELFRQIPGTTNSFSAEFMTETNILVPTTAWGGVAPKSSWRHTPFRKFHTCHLKMLFCSWRHTPFRKETYH